jgi:hypothetical protein
MTETQTADRGELEVLAEKIAAEVGASEAPRDSALVTLAKGMSDAVQALIKGKSAAKIDDEDPKDNDEDKHDASQAADGDDDKDDKDDDEGGASYEDMRMGATDNGAEFLDATEFLAGMAHDLKAMAKANRALTSEVRALRTKVEELDGSSRKDVGMVLQEMAKGVIGLHETLRRTPMIPAAMVAPGMQGKFRVIRESLDKTHEEAGVTPEQMFKAIQSRLIDEDQYRSWKGGTLNDATLLTKIRAL